MKRKFHERIAVFALGLLAAACSDRSLEDEEPPPDIEGLCYEHCVRTMECVWAPGSAAFDTIEGCQRGCEGDNNWDGCPRATEALHLCTTQYGCPYFAIVGTEDVCDPEITAYSVCNPE